LFLDIQTWLDNKQREAFDELQRHLETWKERLLPPKAEGFYIADQHALGEVIHLLSYQLEFAAMVDLFDTFALHDERGNKSTISTTTAAFWRLFQRETFYFLKRHPVRYDLMKHHLYSRMLELCFQGSQKLMKELTWMAHLYVAGMVLNPQTPRWPDMEFAIQRQGVEHLFGPGGLPTTLADSC
jgi:hypothetical protein